MIFAALVLGLIALILAAPAPILLARAHWTTRAPGVALVLWQSIALAGGVSMIGSLLTYGLVPFGDSVLDGTLELGQYLVGAPLPADTLFTHGLALSGAVILAVHLVLNLTATLISAERQRRRHLNLIGLLSDPLPDRPGLRVIDHAAPVAYCLPGGAQSATVLSNGLLRILDAHQLQGVIAHERAHLQQKHHLVLLAFKSWHSALPWFPIANRAETAVALLVELLADDQARRVVDDRVLATAITLVASAHSSAGTNPVPRADAPPPAREPQAGGPSGGSPGNRVEPRVRRLVVPQPPLHPGTRAGVLAASASLLVTPALLLLAA
ncbi:M56 family metallopeptidase [Cryobacterium melibiosiphilum]|uniref:M56 family metallopeptidase n=1 Tax=Cryobacterium melibiosiphilum TaxID=995039 RepID=UPI001F3E4A8C|nr:M56 family metallopeptidase [Cryobacterium melibiosiphilum]